MIVPKLTIFYFNLGEIKVNRKFFTIVLFILFLGIEDLFAENYAIIITGSLPTNIGIDTLMESYNNNGEPTYEEFWNDTFLMWKTLRDFGFEDDNIFVLFGNGEDYYSGPRYPDTYEITNFSATIKMLTIFLIG
jgi:hypothetical protein